MEYYWKNVRRIPKSGKYSDTYGYGVRKTTLFGAAAVYDQDGNLIAQDDNFRSGGGLLPGETNQSDQHVEPRAVKYFQSTGKLKPGYTLVIAVNKEGAPPCRPFCNPYLRETAAENGIRILYLEPSAKPVGYGENNSSAELKGTVVTPRAPIRMNSQLGPGIEPPAGETPIGTRGGTGTMGRGMSGTADALGVFGLAADLYFLIRYGPCGMDPIGMPQCQPQDPSQRFHA